MMRHIINVIEEQTHQILPEIRDEAHAVELFNCGYSTLKFRPSKREHQTYYSIAIPEWFDKFLDEAHAVELFNCGYIMLKFRPSKRERRSTQIKLTTALRFAKQTEAPHVHTSLSPGSDKQLVVIQVAVLP
ncbi:hypothetical protein PHMEG_00032509 [Phytophthora megakarya]|uniref:Uncharacterized protein n=1 Tax=Phytophthora megakarya TaxID=4795 RepID=A0A225UVT0_9STRA|nr:hypothetical protein PHMEG_00032509 [Phytophthora megakarya]